MVKNKDVIEQFVNSQNTRLKTKTVFVDEDTLFSYGYHYPLCFKFKGYFLVNVAGYSATTARHTGDLIRCLTNCSNLTELKKKKEENQDIILINSTREIKFIIDYIRNHPELKDVRELNLNFIPLLMELEKNN